MYWVITCFVVLIKDPVKHTIRNKYRLIHLQSSFFSRVLLSLCKILLVADRKFSINDNKVMKETTIIWDIYFRPSVPTSSSSNTFVNIVMWTPNTVKINSYVIRKFQGEKRRFPKICVTQVIQFVSQYHQH